MKGQNIITCPQCGGNKIQDTGGKAATILASIIMISLGMWIPIIGWFIMIPVGVVMFLYGIISLFFRTTHRKIKCKDKECKHVFKVKIETFKEYQTFLKG